MWLALFSLTYALAASNHPLDGEAEFLWSNGKAAYETGQTKEAVRMLVRFTQKYPGSAGFLDAHDLLARSYFKLGEYKKALAAIKYFTEAQSIYTDRGFRARLLVSDIYLALGQKDKGYLQSGECVVASRSGKGELQARHLLLARVQEAKALLSQNKLDEVGAILKSISIPSDGSISRSENSSLELVRVQYQTAKCSLFASHKTQSESEWKLQMEAKANCLQDLAVKVQSYWKSGDEIETALPAIAQIEILSKNFFVSCNTPPQPTAKMSAQQRKQSSLELKQWMKPICRDNLSKLLDLLNSWPPPSAKGMVDGLNATRRNIETLKQKLHS